MQAKSHFVQPASKNNPAKGKQNKHNSTHLPFINITEEIGGRWNGGKLEPMSVKQKGNIKPMPMIYKMDIAKRKKKEGGGGTSNATMHMPATKQNLWDVCSPSSSYRDHYMEGPLPETQGCD